jgi:hypothetical protein
VKSLFDEPIARVAVVINAVFPVNPRFVTQAIRVNPPFETKAIRVNPRFVTKKSAAIRVS